MSPYRKDDTAIPRALEQKARALADAKARKRAERMKAMKKMGAAVGFFALTGIPAAIVLQLSILWDKLTVPVQAGSTIAAIFVIIGLWFSIPLFMGWWKPSWLPKEY